MLLRDGPADLAGGGEIDILVRPHDRVAAHRALTSAGFATVPSWGRGSHRFWRAYDPHTDGWHQLDVVSELAFGPHQELVVGQAADVLARRREGEIPLPHDDDGFWLLVAHCLLDKGEVAERHRATLTALLPKADTNGSFAPALATAIGGDLSLDDVRHLVGAGRWEELARRGRRARRRATWRSPRAAARRVGHGVVRRSGKVQTAIRRRGLVVALVGPDGAGKSSAASAVADDLPLPVRRRYLGLYGAAAPTAPGWVPGGDLVVKLAWVAATAVVTRWHVLRGRLVLFDRHPVDLEIAPPAAGRAGVRRRILAAAGPDPHLLVVLDAPGHVLHDRSGQHDPEHLEHARQRYLDRARRTPDAAVIDATAPPEQVRREVVAVIWDACARRWSRD